MECTSIKALDAAINRLQSGDWFIVDVDDTLIAPKAMMFRPQSPFCDFIDRLKNLKHAHLAEILSTWRLNRKVILVESEWPAILKQLKDQGVTVLALTQMHTGSFGQIVSIEKWRAAELTKLKLTFSPFALGAIETIIEHDEPATLFEGILFTGPHSKAAVLEAFIRKYTKPNRIVFIDDRLGQIEAIAEFCTTAKIPYHGYRYSGAAKLAYDPSKDFGAIQTQMITNYQWVEDEQASQIQGN